MASEETENNLIEIIYYRLLEMEQRLAEREQYFIQATEKLESMLIKAESISNRLEER